MPDATDFRVYGDIIVAHDVAPTKLMEQLGIETANTGMTKALEQTIWQNRADLPDDGPGVWTPSTAERAGEITRPEHAIALVKHRSLNYGDWHAFAGYVAVYTEECPLVGASITFIHHGMKFVPVYDRNEDEPRTQLIQMGKHLPGQCNILGFSPVTVRTAEHHGAEQLHLCLA